MPAVSTTARDIFLSALDQATPSERAAFISRACAGDAALQRNVEALLRAHEEPDSLLDQARISLRASGGQGDDSLATLGHVPTERIGTLIGRYKLLEQVGEGGMGVVFVAEQTEPVRRRVALKIIKPGMDTKQVIARFEAERQALAMMDHPNIARVLDAGTTDAGRPYFVMELVRGMPITEYCDKVRLSPRQRLELFIDVCQAVQHAHQKGIIHRDLKPSNVMVTTNDGRPVVKVIDFGVAKAVGQQLTERTVYTALTQLVGTPLYMSPEQAELTSNDVDTRSDVYSLGVLLYELLTGQTPFDKEALSKAGFDEMRRMIREDEPLRPSRRFSTLGAAAISTASQHRGVDERRLSKILCGELDWIVMKALEKDRSRRYESASALAADIQRYLSDEPVLACPPTTMYRFQKFARKHKPALATVVAIALCLLLGTTVSAWQAVRATTAEAQANTNAAVAEEKEQEAIKQRDEVKALNEKLVATQAELRSTLYAAHITLAQRAWDAGNVQRVRELLERDRPKPGEADSRGFEWFYLSQMCSLDELSLKGHTENVHSVAFGPDGQLLVSASPDHTMKLWNVRTGQEISSVEPDGSSLWSVAFSPDGKRVAAGTWLGNIKIYEVATAQEVLTIEGHDRYKRVWGVVFSPDSKRLASASDDKTAKVWDAQTGRELLVFRGHDASVSSISFSPDGKRLATSSDKTVKLWDAQSGKELLSLRGHTGATTYVAFSPDGKRLASASGDKSVKLWDAQTGRELQTLLGHTGYVHCLAYSPDGQRLASASRDNTVRIWDTATGAEIDTHKGVHNWVAYSPDGNRLAGPSIDRTVKVWNAQTVQKAVSFNGSGPPALSGDGTRLLAAAKDHSLKIWNVQTGKELLALTRITDGRQERVAYSPDGKLVASPTSDYKVKVWDAQTGAELLSLAGHELGIHSVAFSPDSKRLASASADETIKVWDTQTGRELLSLEGHKHGVINVAYSPDGMRLASSSADKTLKIWDAQSGADLLTLFGHTGRVPCVVFSPNGKRLASCSQDATVRVWDAMTGQELLTLRGHAAVVRGVAFSPDGNRLASASHDSTAKVWDAQSGEELLTLKHSDSAVGVAFNGDGTRLFCGTSDGVKVYDATPVPEKP